MTKSWRWTTRRCTEWVNRRLSMSSSTSRAGRWCCMSGGAYPSGAESHVPGLRWREDSNKATNVKGMSHQDANNVFKHIASLRLCPRLPKRIHLPMSKEYSAEILAVQWKIVSVSHHPPMLSTEDWLQSTLVSRVCSFLIRNRFNFSPIKINHLTTLFIYFYQKSWI